MATDTARHHAGSASPAPLVAALLVVWLLAACTVSPKPEPPITVPKPPTLDASHVSCRALDSGGDPVIVGSPGAVDPAEGFVRAYNLDDTAEAVEAAVTADGGFEVSLAVEPGDEVRLEVIGPTAGSGPSDLVVGEIGAALTPVVRALGDCLSLNPGGLLWVAPGGAGELLVEDLCGGGIELATPRPRSALDRLEVGTNLTWPVTLSANVPAALRVTVLAGGPGDEYLFFVEATAPVAERRAVSVRLEE
jgi:hypothetical protein